MEKTISPGPPDHPNSGSGEGAPPRLSGNLRGILFMFAAALAVAVMHVIVRWLSAEVHPMQIAFFRNVTAFAVLLPFLLRQGPGAFRSQRHGLHALRGLVGAMALLTWFYALYLVPVGDATALSFTAVIFTAIGAIVVLREKVGVRRWAAIVIGLIGTMIILRPGVQAVSLGALVVIASTLLWAAALICVKLLSKTESSVTIVFYASMYFTLVSIPPAVYFWATPTWEHLAIMILIGLMATVGHLCMAEAMRAAEATVVMPLDFTRLIWAAGLGYFAFGEFPDLWTWIGGSIIFASTVYITYRESQTRTAEVAEAVLKERAAK